MKKNMEENPFNEDREEDIRIHERDTSPEPGKKNYKGFITEENVPDLDAQKEVEGGKFIDEDEEEPNEFFEDDEDKMFMFEKQEQEDKRIKQLQQDLYVRSSDGVVSVGPDVEGKPIEHFVQGEDVDMNKMQTTPERESVSLKNAITTEYDSRKLRRRQNTGEEHDNLITLKKKKDEEGHNPWEKREKRGFWRDLFHFGQKKDRDEVLQDILEEQEHDKAA